MDSLLYKKIFAHVLTKPLVPSFFIDKIQLEKNFQDFSQQKPKNVDLFFPVKSLPHQEALQVIAPYLSGFELSTLREKNLIPNEKKILLTNRHHDYEEFNSFSNNCILDIEHLSQIELSDNFAEISLRIQPPHSLFQGKRSRFGLTAKELLTLSKNSKSNSRVKQLHFHLGFEKTTYNDLKVSVEYAIKIKQRYFPNVETINIGGGISYLSREHLTNLFSYLGNQNGHFVIEAGRYFTENACYLLGRVNYLRIRGNLQEIGVNLSKDCHLKWSLPSIYAVYPASTLVNPIKIQGDIKICGPTSYEQDIVLEGKLKKDISLSPGDYLLMGNVSGYSIAWSHSFNGIEEAKIYFI